MKSKLAFMALVSLFASSSFAATKLVCVNSPFSQLTVKLDMPNSQQIKLSVVQSRPDGTQEATPQVGEKSVLTLDEDATNDPAWVIFHSADGQYGQRGYQMNIRIDDLESTKKSFPASMQVSMLSTDMIWHAYDMVCTRTNK